MAQSRCKAAAPSSWRAPKCAPPISRGATDGRHPMGGRTLRHFHVRPVDAGAGRAWRLGDREGDGPDLAAGGDARALHGLSHRRRTVPTLCALRRAVAIADSLYNCLHLGDGGRRRRLSGDAGDANGNPIFLGLRSLGAELARKGWRLNASPLAETTCVFFKVTLDQKRESIRAQGGIAFCRRGVREGRAPATKWE